MADTLQTNLDELGLPTVDLPDLRRRILADEDVSIAELREAIRQLRANRTAPPEKKKATRGAKTAVKEYMLDDLLDG